MSFIFLNNIYELFIRFIPKVNDRKIVNVDEYEQIMDEQNVGYF